MVSGPARAGSGWLVDAALEHRDEEGNAPKEGASADPGHAQPEAAEVESARLLANEARGRLRGRGLGDEEIRRLADEFVAVGGEGDVPAFVRWIEQRGSRAER